MSTAIVEHECEPTVAELLDRLGNVPAERVRLHPPPGHATEDDVLRLHARSNRLFELIDGFWWRKPQDTVSRCWLHPSSPASLRS